MASDPRLVVGLDFGTTFTGIAWANHDGNTQPRFKDVQTFESWPPSISSPKVPSKISYSASDDGNLQWGHDLGIDSKVFLWMKLRLQPRTTLGELQDLRELFEGLETIDKLHGSTDISDFPQHLAKTSEDVVRDYLERVAKVWHSARKNETSALLTNVPMDMVITHPALWPYEAINKIVRAALDAFHTGMFPLRRNIHIISEPEATALYIIQDLIDRKKLSLIKNECFVVCDAGGGPVDLAAYYLESIEPLELVKVGTVTGAPVGAATVDHEWLKWIDNRLENATVLPPEFDKGGHYVLGRVGSVLLDNFQEIKESYTGEEDTMASLQLPRGVRMKEEFQQTAVNGLLTLTVKDMREIFSKSVTGIQDLILRQVTLVENSSFRGQKRGYAENEFLYREINRFTKKWGKLNVERARVRWASVSQGAVLAGLGIGRQIPSKIEICARRYGFQLSEGYEGYRDVGQTKTISPFNGRQLVTRRRVWLIEKGDIILPGKSIVKTMGMTLRFFTEKDRVTLPFVANASYEPPKTAEDAIHDEEEQYNLCMEGSSLVKQGVAQRHGRIGSRRHWRVEVQSSITVTSAGVNLTVTSGTLCLATYFTKL